MENINNASVIEPENTLRPKKKFGKPEIFMILAIILGEGASGLSAYVKHAYFLIMDVVNKDGKISADITYLVSGIIDETSVATGWLLSIGIFILFAFLAYKKFRKSMRFLGIVFVVTQLKNYIFSTATIINSIADRITASVPGTAELIIRIVLAAGFIFVEAAVGALLLMAVEGKFKKKENIAVSPVAEPENTVKHKKKKFGKPELFIILAAVMSFLIPNILQIIKILLQLISSNFLFAHYPEGTLEFFLLITDSLFSGQNTILILIVCVLFAVFAYRNRRIKNALVFIGVFYAAQSISDIFITRPIGYIFNILSDVPYFLLSSNIVDMESYTVIHTIFSSISAITLFIADFADTVIMAVLAVIGLMIVGRKLKKKKKEEPEAPETPVN